MHQLLYTVGFTCELKAGGRVRPSLKDCTVEVAHRLGGSEFQSVIVRGK